MILGGEDFDTAIVNDFTRSFEEARGVSFPIEDSTQIRRLRNEARVAKENMSGMMSPQTIEVLVADFKKFSRIFILKNFIILHSIFDFAHLLFYLS